MSPNCPVAMFGVRAFGLLSTACGMCGNSSHRIILGTSTLLHSSVYLLQSLLSCKIIPQRVIYTLKYVVSFWGVLNRNDSVGALAGSCWLVFTEHICGDYVEFGANNVALFLESLKH